MKKILSMILSITLMITVFLGVSMAEDGIKVIYDGKELAFDVAPENMNGRVMVPMRAVFEAFGAKIKWDNDTQTVTAKKKSKTIEMTVGSFDMKINDKTATFDAAPVNKNGRVLIPIRAIAELLKLDVEWKDGNVIITSPEEDESWKENIGAVDLDAFTVTGEGNTVSGNVITITEPGDYTVTGKSDNGQIQVTSYGKVKLRLSNMSLTNPKGSAIYFKKADKAYITISKDTENFVSDGAEYVTEDNKEKGAITSRDNLEIKGGGALTVTSLYNHGINATGSLEIEEGRIIINAQNDGIHVNDTFEISGGNVKITAKGDGIQSENIALISGGSLDITTTGAVTGNDDASSKGIKAEWLMEISGGDMTLNTTDHAIHCASDLNITGGKIEITSEEKGISAHGDIVIDDGDINIIRSKEGIETKKIMTVNGGNFNIIASDDGINAGGTDSGRGFGGMGGMDRGNRQNGMQPGELRQPWDFGQNTPQTGEMPDGFGEMMPPDGKNQRNFGGDMPQMGEKPDGFGENMPQMGEMPDGELRQPWDFGQDARQPGGFGGFGGNSSQISDEHHIQINGGTFYICANNDGIDANGSLQIDGGTIVIEGRSAAGGGEMGLDTDMALIINGGTVLAAGSTISENNAGQNTALIYLPEMAAAGSKFEIKSDKGETLIELTLSRQCSQFLFSSADLKDGKTYHVYVNGAEKESFEVTGNLTTVGTAQNMGGFGGFGGGRGRR